MTVENSAPDQSDLDESDTEDLVSPIPDVPDAYRMGEHFGDTSRYLYGAIIFLALGLIDLLLASMQRLLPGFLGGIDFLAYGKLFPVATNLLLYGWLTLGLVGALLHVVAASTGGAKSTPEIARLGAPLIGAGVLLGTVGIFIGSNEGRRYLEYPLWADVFILAGILVVAYSVGVMIRRSEEPSGPVHWYAQAALWWLALAFIVGNIPGLSGVTSAVQTAFFRSSLTGLWLVAAGIAIVYHIIPRISGRKAFKPTRLSILGFWSFAVLWAMTNGVDLVYSPAPDWLSTVGALFAISLVIPALVVFADLVMSMRKRWDLVSGTPAIRFVLLGAVLLAAYPVLNLGISFRSGSGIVQFTSWIAGLEQIVLYGIATSWLAAFVYFAAPYVLGRGWSQQLGMLHFRGTAVGLAVWAGASFFSGMLEGWTWIAGANEALPAVGPAFVNTIAASETAGVVAFIGLVIFAIAQFAFVINILIAHPAEATVTAIENRDDDPGPEMVLTEAPTARRLLVGAVGLFAAAALLTFVVPAAETGGAAPSALADTSRSYVGGTDAAAGRAIYVDQGCWYCHTQQVRQIVTDVGLGPVSQAGDFLFETPVLFGVQRIGPDLTHVGSRIALYTGDSAESSEANRAWLTAYLQDPRAERSYSTMPSYDHLSSNELELLAAYLDGLK